MTSVTGVSGLQPCHALQGITCSELGVVEGVDEDLIIQYVAFRLLWDHAMGFDGRPHFWEAIDQQHFIWPKTNWTKSK